MNWRGERGDKDVGSGGKAVLTSNRKSRSNSRIVFLMEGRMEKCEENQRLTQECHATSKTHK